MPRKPKMIERIPEPVKGFRIGGSLSLAWDLAVKNVGIWLALLAIRFALDLVGGGLELVVKHADSTAWKTAALLFRIFFYLPLSIWLTTGFIVVSLIMVRGGTARFEDGFPSARKVGDYIGGTIVLVLLFIFGLLFLIVPGLFFMMKYQFAPYLMVDKGLSLRDAFELSSRMTQGHKWRLFGLMWVCLGVLGVGLLACCIGFFWAWALVQIAYVAVYLTLLEQADPELARKEVA